MVVILADLVPALVTLDRDNVIATLAAHLVVAKQRSAIAVARAVAVGPVPRRARGIRARLAGICVEHSDRYGFVDRVAHLRCQ